MLISIIALAAITVIYILTQSIWITVAAAFAVALILRTLQPIVNAAVARRWPSPELCAVAEEDMGSSPAGRGLRALIVTEHLDYAPEREGLFLAMLDEAVTALGEGSEEFRGRYEQARAKHEPYQVMAGVCGDKPSGVRRCYSQWLREVGAKDFGRCRRDREIFMRDGVFTDPATGADAACAVMFLFPHHTFS